MSRVAFDAAMVLLMSVIIIIHKAAALQRVQTLKTLFINMGSIGSFHLNTQASANRSKARRSRKTSGMIECRFCCYSAPDDRGVDGDQAGQ